MMSPNVPIPRAHFEELKALLDDLSAQSQKLRFCQDCGTKLCHIDAIFTLTGSDQGWNITLPVCPICEEKARSLTQVENKAA